MMAAYEPGDALDERIVELGRPHGVEPCQDRPIREMDSRGHPLESGHATMGADHRSHRDAMGGGLFAECELDRRGLSVHLDHHPGLSDATAAG